MVCGWKRENGTEVMFWQQGDNEFSFSHIPLRLERQIQESIVIGKQLFW